MNKMKSFIKECVALIKGDDAAAVGEKIHRKAYAGLKSQISNMDGELVDLEENVKTAKDNLKLAKFNHGQLITDRTEYVKSLIVAKNELITAESDLASHKELMVFLTDTLASLDREEEC